MKKIISFLIVVLIAYAVYANKDLIKDKVNYYISSDVIEKYKSEVIDITFEAQEIKNEEEIIKGLSGKNVYVNDDFYIYYTYLNDNEKNLYRQILNNAENYVSTFSPEVTVYQDNLEKSIKAVFYDHPELFFLDTTFTYKYNQDNVVVEVSLVFNETMNYIEEAKQNFDNAIDSIVAEAKAYPNILEQEKYVHNKLLEMVDYDVNSNLNQTAYSAVVLRSSVCAGYAKSFQLIMTKLGVPTYYVVGTSNGEHAWNIINLGGNYYNVDATWDDSAYNKYKFFNKSDAEFAQDHTRKEESVLLPSCS